MGGIIPQGSRYAATLGYPIKALRAINNEQTNGEDSNMVNPSEESYETGSTSEWQGCFCTDCRRPERGGISRLAFMVLLLSFLALTGSCTVLFMYVREEVRHMTCGNNLKQIGLALTTYQMQYGTFPPASLCDKTGNPVNSWRTLIVPARLWYNIPSAYDFAKPWDAPENSRLISREKVFSVFQCPSDGNREPAITNYVAVVGSNTMWPGSRPAKRADDGSDDDKILVIEVVNSNILWMEPRDLTLEQALDAIQPKKGIGIGSHQRDGIQYVTVGSQVRTLDPIIDRKSLRKLFVRDSHVHP